MIRRNWSRFTLAAVLALAAGVLASPARAAGGCTPLSGVITGWIADGDEGSAWYGVAYVSFGREPLLVARLVDHNDGISRWRFRDNGTGGFAGNEILTFRIDGVGSFQVGAQFSAVCSGPGGLSGYLHETGKLLPDSGTGRFASMTGNVSIQGPFAGGDCGPEQPCLWISDISGQACTP